MLRQSCDFSKVYLLHHLSFHHRHNLCWCSQPPFYNRDVGEMYDGILHKPLPLPAGKSDAVNSLLLGLLQKDQHRRLGAIADFVSGFLLKGSSRSSDDSQTWNKPSLRQRMFFKARLYEYECNLQPLNCGWPFWEQICKVLLKKRFKKKTCWHNKNSRLYIGVYLNSL